jgi:CHAT domain-containing protein/Tfp pilus assembly protein PilF
MTTRFEWTIVRLIAFCTLAFQQSAVASQAQPAGGNAEAGAPKPPAAVEKILNEANRLAETKQPLDSLKAADQALAAARQANDTPGAALAQQMRAKSLQDLQRTDEAVAAWQDAAQIWARSGDTPEQITALVQAGLLYGPDRKSDAQRLFEQGLSVGKVESPRPLAVAQSLHDAGVALGSHGPQVIGYVVLGAREQEPRAIDYLSAALAIREKAAPNSLKVAETLNAYAKLALEYAVAHNDDEQCSRAKDYSARAVEIGQRLAPDSAIVVESLHRLGRSEYELSYAAHPSAAVHYLAALRIQKTLEPDGSVEQSSILLDLGKMEDQAQTNYAASREHLAEAVAIAERLAPVSELSETSLRVLAVVERHLGDLPAAREHAQRALAIGEKVYGKVVASTTLNLGLLAADQGDYAAAHDYFEKALAIFLTVTTRKTAGVPIALENLGTTFYEQGDLGTALKYHQRALAIYEKDWGDSPGAANNLKGMGDIFLAQGNLTAAANYYQKALNVEEKVAPESFNVSISLRSLAKVARKQGNQILALEYDRHALEMGQKYCPNSWCVAGVLNDLGELSYERGDLAGAESYLLRALEIREKSLGSAHPDVGRSLNDLALTMAAQGRRSESLEAALRAEGISAEHLRVSVRTLSERRALAYEGIRASGLDLALTLAGERGSTPSARSQVLDAVIRSRALVFDELAARHRTAYGSGNPEVTQLADQLSSARARLATLVFRGVGDTPPEAYRKLLDEARERKEKAEQMLAEKSIAFRQDQARAQLGLKEIAAFLPPDAALVAFVHYSRHDLQRPGPDKAPPTPVPSYAAFVLRTGAHEPEFVPLGAAREIEGLLTAWRRAIARPAEVMDVSSRTSEDSYRRAGAGLRRRIWDPLIPGLGAAREVFVVPDAALHLVSLASLPVGSSQYLVETGPLIHYLSTERDLVPAQSRHGEGILVVGNPAFDRAGKLVVAGNKPSALASTTAGPTGALLRGTRSACGTFQTLRFPPLPGSQQEAENIAALWKQSTAGEGAQIQRGSTVQPGSGELLQMTGADASPEAFEQYAPGKQVLHVATHGFFLEGSCESAVQRRLDADKRDENFLPATAENPLLLSGLAFAGANRRASAKPDETDGILTAEEIAGLNLEGVDWAVLSACDTGVGEVKVGEGVFGLRRAFQVAGAKTVIMSLWPVEDETTQQWMGTLYREHFLNGKDTGKSVRAASLQILRQRLAKHKSTHPFYWGAFIAAGDWH